MYGKSLDEIAVILLEVYNGNNISDDYRPSLKQLKYMILDWRATIIRRDQAKGRKLVDSMTQNLGKIDMQLVDESDVYNFTIGKKILRSVKQIPTPLRVENKETLNLYLMDRKTPIYRVGMDEINSLSYRKYTSNKKYWYLQNKYIYMPHNETSEIVKSIPYIYGTGAFENPFDAGNFDGSIIFDDDSEFPIPLDMVTQLRQALLSGELKITRETPEDYVNNALPN